MKYFKACVLLILAIIYCSSIVHASDSDVSPRDVDDALPSDLEFQDLTAEDSVLENTDIERFSIRNVAKKVMSVPKKVVGGVRSATRDFVRRIARTGKFASRAAYRVGKAAVIRTYRGGKKAAKKIYSAARRFGRRGRRGLKKLVRVGRGSFRRANTFVRREDRKAKRSIKGFFGGIRNDANKAFDDGKKDLKEVENRGKSGFNKLVSNERRKFDADKVKVKEAMDKVKHGVSKFIKNPIQFTKKLAVFTESVEDGKIVDTLLSKACRATNCHQHFENFVNDAKRAVDDAKNGVTSDLDSAKREYDRVKKAAIKVADKYTPDVVAAANFVHQLSVDVSDVATVVGVVAAVCTVVLPPPADAAAGVVLSDAIAVSKFAGLVSDASGEVSSLGTDYMKSQNLKAAQPIQDHFDPTFRNIFNGATSISQNKFMKAFVTIGGKAMGGANDDSSDSSSEIQEIQLMIQTEEAVLQMRDYLEYFVPDMTSQIRSCHELMFGGK